MRDGYWVVRSYTSGKVGEKVKFFVAGARPDARSRKKERDAMRKQAQNQKQSVREAARIFNANFGAGDYLLGLDYSAAGMAKLEAWSDGQEGQDVEREDLIRQAAERELQLCLRRVRRALAREGKELRYHLAVTSDMDGETGTPVRVHHHLIINREAREAFTEKWKRLGGVSWEPLREQDDYLPVAEYILGQVRKVKDAKSYVSSRNLIRPQPKDRVALSGVELRVPKGGRLLYRGPTVPGLPQYLRYVLPENRRTPPGDGQRRAEQDEATVPSE